jgi:hypothetical protein
MDKNNHMSDELISLNEPRTSLLGTLINLLALVGFSCSLLVAGLTVIYIQISNAKALSAPTESPTSIKNPGQESSSPTLKKDLSSIEKTYPASIPWIEEKELCELSGRMWKDKEKTCWDGNHSYLF